MATTSATHPIGAATADDLAQVLLDVSLTGIILFRPLYAAPDGPIQDLAYEHLNPAAQQMLRLPECPTDTFLTLYPGAQETGIFAFYAAAFASGQTERYQSNYQRDGLDGYFYLVARRHGELLVVSFTDTNDQPRSAVEEALRQSQAREQQALAEAQRRRAELERVFAQSPIAIGLLRGPELITEMANAGMAQIWGRPVEQVLGRPHFEALPDLAGQGFEQVLATVLATGQPYVQPEQLITVTHTQQPYQRYLNVSYHPAQDATGQSMGILVYASDVTEQVLARQQVQQLNQELAATNEELAATNEELTASNEEYLHVNTALGEVQQQLRQLNADLESRVQQRTQELQASHRATAALQAEVLAAAQRQVQEREDLNETLAATNAELHETNTRLTRTNTDLSTFVYTASHDLKAPITNIEGLVLALRDRLPAAVQQDELVAHLLNLLDTTAHRFVNTISQLTDLSRLQRAYEEPAESLALAPVVDDVLADLAPVIAEAGAVVQVQVPAELRVSFAPASLRSIVYNLLSNAVKYRNPLRLAQVWIEAKQQPQGLVFTVRDNGLGLTDSQQQRLFHVFQRLHTHVEGSGVGLYMIKRLIENAGATITVTSTVDVGTTFTVTFPV